MNNLGNVSMDWQLGDIIKYEEELEADFANGSVLPPRR